MGKSKGRGKEAMAPAKPNAFWVKKWLKDHDIDALLADAVNKVCAEWPADSHMDGRVLTDSSAPPPLKPTVHCIAHSRRGISVTFAFR